MKDAPPQTIRLADYKAPNWLIEDVHLTFRLHPTKTVVKSRIQFTPNPDTTDRHFELMGDDLTLLHASVDGQKVSPEIKDGLLTAQVPDAPFTWEAEVEINPSANTALDGLYMSNGIYCTQCEAEGFRKITFYPDRPDVMACFTVRIESDLPVLLSNGNPVTQGDGFAEWHDPWPKPSYLFALVAGDLVAHSGQQTTSEGRDVTLNIWVRPGDETRCDYALDALKRSMVWDEDVYGRAYDLDVFNLVAIDDFNAGAMENKGLNIFNSTYVLASPETATDDNYEWIESVVAHEYFHNWTGNRITCRDWFQLCLKEGLTVFRDQQFTSDMRSAPMKRIADVLKLRARQFREDNGPLAHPVRPEEYIEINNFYTSTVYDKGAEVIGMLKTIVGDDAYAKALDLYFDRHDGQACTIENWLKVFEDTTGKDLSQFKLWYSQAGTPRVEIKTEITGKASEVITSDGSSITPVSWTITARQHTPPTPGQPEKRPFAIPIKLAGYDQQGRKIIPEMTHIMTQEKEVLGTGSFLASDTAPIISAFRGFSAPVIVEQDSTTADRLTLLAHDTDPFNRWEAGRVLAKEQLMGMITKDAAPSTDYITALGKLLSDDTLDPAFRAFALGLPSPDDTAHTIFEAGQTPDPTRIDTARTALQNAIAAQLHDTFDKLFSDMETPGAFRPDAKDAARRALRIGALAALTRTDGPDRAKALYASADNMTETLGALAALIRTGDATSELDQFYDRWKSDANVLDKWFSIQVAYAQAKDAHTIATTLADHPDFTWKTPNRFRSLIGAFAGNMAAFHQDNGAGYAFVADWLAKLDPLNPQTAARLATVFETKRIFDGDRQSMITDSLKRLNRDPSRNLGEIVTRILGT